MASDLSRIVELLSAIQGRVQLSLPSRRRLVSAEDYLTKRALILVGPRGSGKSTFLASLSQQQPGKSFYASLDNPILAGVSLFELGDWLFQNGYETLICDEVHFHPDWSTHLKALYDSHPNKQIWASDSSTLVLKKGLGDLSRRFLIREFSYLSFREYLWLKHGLILPKFSYEDLLSHDRVQTCHAMSRIASNAGLNLQAEFRNHSNDGMRPFCIEGDYQERLKNIIDKIIHTDIPHFLPEVRDTHLNLMRHVIGYLATSPIPSLNIDSLSKTWSVAKLTVYHLLTIMENTSLIQIIPYEGLKKGQSKGAKIFFSDPSLYHAYTGSIGNTRESYFCNTIRSIHLDPRCPKEDCLYDYRVHEHTFEIGGRSKKAKSADFVVRDDTDLAHGKVIPLWLFGMLERPTP